MKVENYAQTTQEAEITLQAISAYQNAQKLKTYCLWGILSVMVITSYVLSILYHVKTEQKKE